MPSGEKNSPNVEGKITMEGAHLYEQLEWERQDKSKWIEKYHQADKERGVLQSQKNSSTIWDVVFSFLLTIAGSLGVHRIYESRLFISSFCRCGIDCGY